MSSADLLAIIDEVLPSKLSSPVAAKAYAPSNIALSKYWGKRDKTLNLPLNSSLSISLREWGSTTQIKPSEDGEDSVWFEGTKLGVDDPFAIKVLKFASMIRRNADAPLKIETNNTIPPAAGLASSASGFAALTLAIDKAFQMHLPSETLSVLARIGSGSASRSLWHGFVRWDKGYKDNGLDSHAHHLDVTWPEFRIAIVPVDTGPKSQSSRDGMNHTVATSPLFVPWPEQAEKDCEIIETAVRAKDFTKLGETAEANALAMHATMMAARPSLTYLKPESWAILDVVWQSRKQGVEIYATMDAGANVKLIFQESVLKRVQSLFPKANIINPFKPFE